MISNHNFVNQSLELNLFFLRIMKEHAIFLEVAFALKNNLLISRADHFKSDFENLLSHAITLSDTIIEPKKIDLNEDFTKYTLDAEEKTELFTGISIDTSLTRMESALKIGPEASDLSLITNKVHALNYFSIAATQIFIEFKTRIKNDISSCKLFTTSYTSMVGHMIEEAQFFVDLLTNLQNGIEIDTEKDLVQKEAFWDEKMTDHSLYIRGMLDPEEKELFEIANKFADEFETLTKEASSKTISSAELTDLTSRTLSETIKLRDFKAKGTEGILACKIKSIILPLLSDHVLRESSHFINILEGYKKP